MSYSTAPDALLRAPDACDGIDASSGLLATNLPLLPGSLQLPVSLRVDLLLPSRQLSFGVMYPVALFRRTLL